MGFFLLPKNIPALSPAVFVHRTSPAVLSHLDYFYAPLTKTIAMRYNIAKCIELFRYREKGEKTSIALKAGSDALFMNQQFKSVVKFLSLIGLAVIGELILSLGTDNGSGNYYSLYILIVTVIVFSVFGMVLGGNDLFQYLTSRLRVKISHLKLSLGLAGLTIFITVGILALFEPGNNFAPNGVFEFFLKSPAFTPLYLISCGYMLADSVEKYEGMF